MDAFRIADKTFSSRLIVGTGKYSSPAVMLQAHEASGADRITVAVRRVNISDRTKESLLDYIDTAKYFLLPNTAGCYTADEAIRTARLGRDAARGAHRLGPRHPEHQQSADHPRVRARAAHHRCRRGHRIRRDDRDG